MLIKLTEEQRLIKETAREFAEKELVPHASEIDRAKEIPQEIFTKLADLGFWSILVPEEYGGAGLDHTSLIIVLEEISRACASTSVTLSVHNSLACGSIIKYGNPDQKRKYLPLLAKGEIIGAYALTEPNAGSDAGSLESRAVKDGKYYVLNGTKLFITNGPISGLIIVFVRTHPDKSLRGKGISAFLIEPGFKGLKRGPKEDKMGTCGANMCEVVFEDCLVPEANLLGRENKGFSIALGGLDKSRIDIAVQSVGIARAALDASLKYARERKQFGKFISEFGAIQWKLAEMATEIEAARLLTYQAALLSDQGVPHSKESSMAKLFASTICNKVAKEAVQIYGGMGYTKDFPVERHFRDAKITEIYEGTSEIQRLVIARSLLKQP